MTIIISGDTGVPVSPVTGTLAVANGGTGVTTSTGSGAVVLGTSPSISGAVMSTMGSSVITSGTAVASTSGTSIDFTGIPSWVKRITVMFSGVSFTSTSPLGIVQIGSGSVTTSGYLGTLTTLVSASSVSTNAMTTGFGYANFSGAAADTVIGAMVLTTLGSNVWVAFGTFGNTNTLRGLFSGGNITLGGALDRVRITTTDGTTTFDAGSINILYE